MHELGITRRLLEVVLARAREAGASRVSAVHLELGEESDVAPESLAFYWADLARATPAEHARLLFSAAAAGEPWACRVVAIDAD